MMNDYLYAFLTYQYGLTNNAEEIFGCNFQNQVIKNV